MCIGRPSGSCLEKAAFLPRFPSLGAVGCLSRCISPDPVLSNPSASIGRLLEGQQEVVTEISLDWMCWKHTQCHRDWSIQGVCAAWMGHKGGQCLFVVCPPPPPSPPLEGSAMQLCRQPLKRQQPRRQRRRRHRRRQRRTQMRHHAASPLHCRLL